MKTCKNASKMRNICGKVCKETISYRWYIPSMSLIIVVPKGTGPNVVKMCKNDQNAKYMWKSMIRRQGTNLIWMVHTLNEPNNCHSKGDRGQMWWKHTKMQKMQKKKVIYMVIVMTMTTY